MKLGFIGAGNMGAAILEGITARGVIRGEDVVVFDGYKPALERACKTGARAAANNGAVAEAADMVILAVKPKDSLDVLREIAPKLEGKALLSIVAGLSYKAIAGALRAAKAAAQAASQAASPAGASADGKAASPAAAEARVLVILPNTPALVGEGAAGFTLETTFTDAEKAFAQKLFEAVGIVEWVPEKLLNAVSALSGGGPAYAAMFAEALADGGVLEGLPRPVAIRLAAQTLKGTGKLLLETGQHPGMVKDAVCSPGGTTIEAVRKLEKGAFRYSVTNAVRASARKFGMLIKNR